MRVSFIEFPKLCGIHQVKAFFINTKIIYCIFDRNGAKERMLWWEEHGLCNHIN